MIFSSGNQFRDRVGIQIAFDVYEDWCQVYTGLSGQRHSSHRDDSTPTPRLSDVTSSVYTFICNCSPTP